MKEARTTRLVGLFAAAFVVVALALPKGSGVAPQSKTTTINGHEAVAGEVLVKFRTPPGRGEVERAVDADQSEEIGNDGVRRLHSRSLDTRGLITSLAHRADVEYAEPNYILRADVFPNDPSFRNLWGLVNTGQTINQAGIAGADISADTAWDLSKGSKANVVAVVDTGIDYTHPDLAGNVWSAPRSFTVTVGGRSITCPAGSHGFNAITLSCDPMDDNDHGTHVSGTIGAVGNNGVGVVGVNWTAAIMGAKFLNANGSGTTANAVNAIEFAIQAKQVLGADANVRVLSNSWGGGGYDTTLYNEISKANSAGMLFVAAAGNSGANNDTTANYPSNYAVSNVVAVAATDNRDQLASFSNYGANMVDLGAPGVYIYSTVRSNGYAWMSGTSMATPHVSGAAALVLAYCPSLSTAGLVSTILGNVDPVASLAGKTVTGGRLNVSRALTACGGSTTPDFSVSVSPSSQTVASGGTATYSVSATGSGGWTGSPSWSVSGLPSGVSAGFSPTAGTSSTLTITTGGTAAGTYPFTITGNDGSRTRSAAATLVISAPVPADFALSVSPSSITIKRGSTGNVTVTITPTGGFSGSVSLSATGLPSGASASFSPNPATSTSRLTIGSLSSRGTYTVTIRGTSGSVSHTAGLQLKVR